MMGAVMTAGALVAAAFALAPPSAQAHEEPVPAVGVIDQGQRPGQAPGPAYRYGFDRGWRDGSENGHQDGRRGRLLSEGLKGAVRAAERGYRAWMGVRSDYLAGYREGYTAGFRRAYLAARPERRERPVPPGGRALYRPPP
jgi:hypothetical protein